MLLKYIGKLWLVEKKCEIVTSKFHAIEEFAKIVNIILQSGKIAFCTKIVNSNEIKMLVEGKKNSLEI